MRIQLYKIGIPEINQIEVENDTNGRFTELLMVRNLLEEYGHEVFIEGNQAVDILFLFNGIWNAKEIYNVNALIQNAKQVSFINTDYRLSEIPRTPYNLHKKIDFYFTQTKQKIANIEQKYNGMPELACYKSNIPIKTNKSNLFIFGGGIRNRREDMLMYFEEIRRAYGEDLMKLFIKTSEKDHRIPIQQYHQELLDSRYSLVIMDQEYYDIGFITWRFYENLSKGVISFVDSRADKYNLMVTKNSFLRVNDPIELVEKIKLLELGNNREIFLEKIYNQSNEHTVHKINDLKNGKYTYKCLLNL